MRDILCFIMVTNNMENDLVCVCVCVCEYMFELCERIHMSLI